ncbi:hypothetical protein RhiirA1_469088 [Rhizophagus irregularis]|uniref:Uncharacterized protein n=1 Tax=Rhizophagus irregularis TaxID=588596 RepID=A0A2N0R8Q2_9GLOM|nr:hypothetical protein RhiirA1_469088 [Rhizophagus irregularis]
MSKTPCSVLNSKIRGKKVYLPDDDESLISTALSLVWTKTDKKIDSCTFEQDRVRMSYKKNEGCIYFDLKESLSNFTFINKDNLAELQHYKSLYELYKSKYELVLNHNVSLEYSTPVMAENTRSSDTAGTANTDSNIDESLKQLLNYSTPEHAPFESLTSTSHSSLYRESNNSELARVINCNNNSQTANIANSDSIIGELSYHKTNESVESNSPSQALPAVANKSDKLNVPPVANKNNELNSPPQVLPIANKSTDNESIKLNSSIQAPPVAVPEKVSVDSKITHIEIGRKSI